MLTMYDYPRSSASYRVRIALALKNISHQLHNINLLEDGGQHKKPEYLRLNPQGLVPALQIAENQVLSQSIAIIEYLDEIYPNPPLLPNTAIAKAEVRSMALGIACDIHPLNNLRVLNKLKQDFNANESEIIEWYHTWLLHGFESIENQLTKYAGTFCFEDTITIADLCLIPQVFNAKRYKFDLSPYPLISKINDHCLTIPAFSNTAP